MQNLGSKNILTVRQINESLVRGLARGWQFKKMLERGLNMKEMERSNNMGKRTIMRYLNLCYLSPSIVSDILEYTNPNNLTLRELMNLAEGNVDFSKQEKMWKIN